MTLSKLQRVSQCSTSNAANLLTQVLSETTHCLSRKQVSHVAEKRVVLDLLWLGNWFAHMEGVNRRDRDNPKQILTVLELDHLSHESESQISIIQLLVGKCLSQNI